MSKWIEDTKRNANEVYTQWKEEVLVILNERLDDEGIFLSLISDEDVEAQKRVLSIWGQIKREHPLPTEGGPYALSLAYGRRRRSTAQLFRQFKLELPDNHSQK